MALLFLWSAFMHTLMQPTRIASLFPMAKLFLRGDTSNAQGTHTLSKLERLFYLSIC